MKHFLIAILVFIAAAFASTAVSQEAVETSLDGLLQRLTQSPNEGEVEQINEEIWALFYDSGSPTVDLLLQRGIAAEAQGMTDLASDFYGDVIEFAPKFAEGYNRRAGLEIKRDNYSAALEDLNKTLELQPRHFDAFASLGLVLERLGAEAAAFQAYQDALAINPYEETANAGAARLNAVVKGRSL